MAKEPNLSRREAVLTGAVLAGTAALLTEGKSQAAPGTGGQHVWERSYSGGPEPLRPLPPGLPRDDYQPVVTPNGATLDWKIVEGVKVYHLVAEEVEHEFAP